jgi:hypothetical protein
MTRYSVVCIVARLLSERSRFRIPAVERYFFSFLKHPERLWGPLTSHSLGTGVLLPGLIRHGSEVDNFSASKTVVEN